MKIAIYGGAFNPVHKGHIEIVKQLSEQFDFDKILIIPSKFSPHKSNNALVSDNDRLNMCKLAFNNIEKCEVSDIEIKRNNISYTVETLYELRTIYPCDEIYLVCGSDMFLSLLDWRKPEEIFKMANILAFRRDNEDISKMNEYKKKLNNLSKKVIICEVKIPPFSSTEVRNAIKENMPFQNYVTKEIYSYIKDNKLYL